jgi:hypothetical protein
VPHLWRYQEFSAWMTDSMHDAGGPALNRPFREMTALARLDELFDSSVAGRLRLAGGAAYAGLTKTQGFTGRRSNESRLERNGLGRSILRFSGVRSPTASVRRD